MTQQDSATARRPAMTIVSARLRLAPTAAPAAPTTVDAAKKISGGFGFIAALVTGFSFKVRSPLNSHVVKSPALSAKIVLCGNFFNKSCAVHVASKQTWV